jgi:hypothetical protein
MICLRAVSSEFSMKKLAVTSDIGEPFAVPSVLQGHPLQGMRMIGYAIKGSGA